MDRAALPRRSANLLWVHGGDRNPWDVRDEVRALAQAIREVDERHLHTAPLGERDGGLRLLRRRGLARRQQLLHLRAGGLAHPRRPRGSSPRGPTFLIESHYENDFGGKTADDVRAYPYRAVLSGAAGHLFGNKPLWFCGRGWEQALDSPGARYMTHALALFRSRPWYELEPDRRHQFVVEGHWESGADDGVQAARHPRPHDARSPYLPAARRQVRVDLEQFAGPAASGATGSTRARARRRRSPPFDRRGSTAFAAPADGDWVLVLDDEAKRYGPPGGRAR